MEFESAVFMIGYLYSCCDFCIDDLRWEHEDTLELFDFDELADYLESIQDSVETFYLYCNTFTVEVRYFSRAIVRLYCF